MPVGVYKRSKDQLKKLTEMSRAPRGLRGGGYFAIHKWLKQHFGKADRCEGSACNGKSKNYYWAKIQDCTYEHKRENFIMLCASCHRLYDQKPEWFEKVAAKLRGKKHTLEHKEKIKAAMAGRNKGKENPNWKGGPDAY